MTKVKMIKKLNMTHVIEDALDDKANKETENYCKFK